MTALATVHSLATYLPARCRHESLLGTAVPGAYLHLFDPSGATSRPPTVRRGVSSLFSEPYEAPTAADELRVSQLASAAVRQLLLGQDASCRKLRGIFHTQCTLDQQILGSTCLRICHEYAPQTRLARTFGQLGTAGIPTVLRLAAQQWVQWSESGRKVPGETAADEALLCVTASDKWIAPFFRRVPGLVTFADAAAACLIAPANGAGIATIEAIHTSLRPFDGDLWTAPAAAMREHLAAHAVSVVQAVIGPGPDPWLEGDLYADGLGKEVARRTGLPPLQHKSVSMQADETHLSSASPLFALSRAIEACVASRKPLQLIVWTASIAGIAGAMRLTCYPTAQWRDGAWHLAKRHAAVHLSTTPSKARIPA